MSTSDTIGLARDVAALLALLIGGAVGVFVLFRFAPLLTLRILPRWSDETEQVLLVAFEVENKSRVRAVCPEGWARIQVLEYPIRLGMSLSEWVPFSKERERPDEKSREYHDPVHILTSTERIYPGEVLSVQRLYHYPEEALILHIGLQVQLNMGLLGKIARGTRKPLSQTATCFAVKTGGEDERHELASVPRP
jgi:hypothetical protein